ncbi:type IV pilin [Natrarchaeobius oligotrophus]
MVAITVILAAVIAAFVIDLGGSVGQESQAGVSISVDEGSERITVEVTSMGNADHVNLTSNAEGTNWPDVETTELQVGDVVTLTAADDHVEESGSISAVAVITSSDTETMVQSERWDFS